MPENDIQGARSPLCFEAAGLFRKELIRVGEYTMPGDPERRILITPERLQNWAQAFSESGVKVWVPLGHSRAPEQNAGWVRDMVVEEDTLIATLEITDEEVAEKLREGSIADVSIGVEYDFVDCNGRSWAEMVRHVALTVDPHIRQQNGFDELKPEEPDLPTGETEEAGMDSQTVPINAEAVPAREESIPGQAGMELEAQKEIKRLRVNQDVTSWLHEGRITPAVQDRLVFILNALEGKTLEWEGNSVDLSAVLRGIISDLPLMCFAQGSRSRYSPPHPVGETLNASERELLHKLGLNAEVYLRHRQQSIL